MKNTPELLVIVALLWSPAALSQGSVLGKWKTIDDSSGEEKSVVEIFERQGKVFGKIVRLFTKKGDNPDPVCNKCPKDDPRYNRKVVGMEILADMSVEKEAYAGGLILDPESGNIYRCRIWVEKGELKVRGYWGPFYRTQTWKKLN